MTETPLHRRIADALREAVLSGELTPGQPIPSENELAVEVGRSVAVLDPADRLIGHPGLQGELDLVDADGLAHLAEAAAPNVTAR